MAVIPSGKCGLVNRRIVLLVLRVCVTGQALRPLQPLYVRLTSRDEQRPEFEVTLHRCQKKPSGLNGGSSWVPAAPPCHCRQAMCIVPSSDAYQPGVLTAVNPDLRGTNSGSDVIRMAPVGQVWSRHSSLPETGSGARSYFLAPPPQPPVPPLTTEGAVFVTFQIQLHVCGCPL